MMRLLSNLCEFMKTIYFVTFCTLIKTLYLLDSKFYKEYFFNTDSWEIFYTDYTNIGLKYIAFPTVTYFILL